MLRNAILFALISTLVPTASNAAGISLQMVIELDGEAQRNLVRYKCDQATDLVEVEYLNADPNFLALMTVDGEKRVFVSSIAASGVRYLSGQYVWWTKGGDADLFDETKGPNAPALVTCIEVGNTP